MLACRVVVIKWVAQYTHITRAGQVIKVQSWTLAFFNLYLIKNAIYIIFI